MADHGSSENSINRYVGHIDYRDLHAIVTGALAGFANLYAYGVLKCTFLNSSRIGRPTT